MQFSAQSPKPEVPAPVWLPLLCKFLSLVGFMAQKVHAVFILKINIMLVHTIYCYSNFKMAPFLTQISALFSDQELSNCGKASC